MIRLAAICLLLVLQACGQRPSNEYISSDTITSSMWNGVQSIQQQYQVRFSQESRSALNKGLSLKFVYQIQLVEKGRWYHQVIESSQTDILLSYSALTRRYLLQKAGQKALSLTELRNVQIELGRFQTMFKQPVQGRLFRTRLYLDIETLPPPLRIEAYNAPTWKLDSGWVEWRL